MDCPIGKEPEVLLDYCAGRLAAAAAAEVRTHIGVCSACRRFAEEQSAAWHALDAVPAPEVSQDFDRKLWARIERDEGQANWWAAFRARLVWRPALGVALGCVLVMAAVLLQTPPPLDYADQAQADAIEPERIESALDDLEMLRQWAAMAEAGRAM